MSKNIFIYYYIYRKIPFKKKKSYKFFEKNMLNITQKKINKVHYSSKKKETLKAINQPQQPHRNVYRQESRTGYGTLPH